jgi:hypothetical protein
VISTQLINPGNRREFRFESTWFKHAEFSHKVAQIWEAPTRNESNLDKVLFKLKKVRKIMKGWSFNLAESRKKKKKDLLEEIADLELQEELGALSLE